MPPNQLFKQSKTKMQAWVTNNGLSDSQPAPSDHEGPNHPRKRHIYLPQPQPQPQPTPPPTQQTSPSRSRAPVVNTNADRTAAVMAARIPVPSRSAHSRNPSVNVPPTRATSSEPLQTSKKPMPFWEGSTIDGSVFSDAASNLDASTATSHHHHRIPFQAPAHQQRNPPRHRPSQGEESEDDEHPPILVAPDGRMQVMKAPLARSASTPDARNQRVGFHVAAPVLEPDPEPDRYSEDSPSPYQTSPDRTPSSKRLHHPRPLTLRTNRRESLSERDTRASYPRAEDAVSSPQNEAYQGPDIVPDQVRTERPGLLRVQEPIQSTILADTGIPMVSHSGESDSELESVDQQPTPKPAPKPKPQVSRQLFSKNSKGKVGLREHTLPHLPLEKRQPNSKKRQYELDYDDGALHAMNFMDLKGEAFDYDPARAEAQSAVEPPRGTLPEKLTHFLDKDQASQMEFFNKMPVKDWEDSGDWFLEKFGEVVEQFRNARREKRGMVQNFENEIAAREEAVGNKIHGIDKTLAELKNEGEGMMVGKEFG